MIKFLAPESAWMNKDTNSMLIFNATVNFNRMYHEYGNMLNAKENLDCTIYQCISATIERSVRNAGI